METSVHYDESQTEITVSSLATEPPMVLYSRWLKPLSSGQHLQISVHHLPYERLTSTRDREQNG